MTAGNSTPLTDGASAVLLGSEEWAAAHGLTPAGLVRRRRDGRGRLRHAATRACSWRRRTPCRACSPATASSLQDFDFYEIHEAFAATVLSTLAAWEDETFCRERLGLDAPLGAIDRTRLNVDGSSLAAGHPFAATGRSHRRHPRHAAPREGARARAASISICAAGGQGVVAILEAA